MAMMTGDSLKMLRRIAAAGLAACVLSVAAVRQAAAQDKRRRTTAPDPDKVTLNFFRNTEIGGLVDALRGCTLEQGAAVITRPSTSCTTRSTSAWPNSGSPSRRPPTRGSATRSARPSDPRPTSWRRPPASSSRNLRKNIEEAFGSYLAPVGKGLQIDVGKFVTNAGAEVIEAKDDWNYSRSLLFQLAIPLYHSGVRADLLAERQGHADGRRDQRLERRRTTTTRRESVMASVTFKPSGSLSIIENYIGGPEQPNDNDDWRTLSDTVISYTVDPTAEPDGQLRLRPRHRRDRHQRALAGRARAT